MGCVIQAGLGQNVARQASIKAGLPIETPAVTVNVVCGSGLNCVNMAAQMIEAGDADIVVAGGMENMSMAPYAMMQGRFGYRMNNGKLVDTMVNDALWDAFNQYHMMITAENVADQWNLTREELDEFAASSQQKCEAAIAAGGFDAEIVPVQTGVDRKTKEPIIFSKDEGPRAGTTAESLSKLKCCSGKEGGVVTAGNASGINDGAAAIVVMSEEKAKELGVTPMATFIGGALGGVDPAIMGVGPVASTNKLLKKTGLTIDDTIVSINVSIIATVTLTGTAVKPTPAPTKTPGKVVPSPQEKTEIIQVGNVRYKQLSANTVKMTGIKKDVKKVTVPATIKYKGKTYKVTEVASGALRGKKKLQTVVIVCHGKSCSGDHA